MKVLKEFLLKFLKEFLLKFFSVIFTILVIGMFLNFLSRKPLSKQEKITFYENKAKGNGILGLIEAKKCFKGCASCCKKRDEYYKEKERLFKFAIEERNKN